MAGLPGVASRRLCDPAADADAATGTFPVGRSGGAIFAVVLEAGMLLGLLLLAAQLRLMHLEHYTGSFDEGVRMEQLLLMEHGYRPFRDIFASQGPLLLDALYPFYLLGGKTLGAARLGVATFSLALLIGAWWTLRPLHPLAGLAAATLLALSPVLLDSSRLALAELPSLAPCVWAIGCAVRWQRGGRDRWLYAATGLAMIGVLVKPMALPVVAPLAVLALSRLPRRPLVLLTASGLAALVAGLVLVALDAASVWEVLGQYRGGAQRAAGSLAAQNLGLIVKILREGERIGFLSLVVLGAVIGLVRGRTIALALMSWPVGQVALFLLYTDLADKHVVYCVPQLALVGGLTTLALVGLPRRSGLSWRVAHGRDRVRLAALGALVAGLVLYAATVPLLWRDQRELLRDGDDRARRDYAGTMEQTALMAHVAGPDEFVLTDHPIAAFYARRMVPPWLVDTSGTRVDAGSLTSEVAIREAEVFRPVVVVTWRRRLGKLEAFGTWLGREYRLLKTYPGSDPANPLQVYVRSDREQQARAFLASR